MRAEVKNLNGSNRNNVIICPVCGTENRMGWRFCARCGSSLANPASNTAIQPDQYNQNGFTAYDANNTMRSWGSPGRSEEGYRADIQIQTEPQNLVDQVGANNKNDEPSQPEPYRQTGFGGFEASAGPAEL